MTTFTTEDRKKAESCIECGKPATCIRHTQFAGDHPYCKDHGMEQEDYFVDDSYTYWTEYELASHEEQQEWAKRRNDPWDDWKASKDIV
jgi:hypothetical protein